LAAAWLDTTLLEVKLLEWTELLLDCALEILLDAALPGSLLRTTLDCALLLAGIELAGTTMTRLEAVELLDASRE